jgi:DNA-binding transcriptional ArsR family regulator
MYAYICIYMHTHPILLSALADPTRLRIVEVLRQGECAVGEVVERVGIHQSGVSRHLGILQETGIVGMRPQGQRRLYSLRHEPFREVAAWLDGYRDLWNARLGRFEAELDRRTNGSADPSKKEQT